MAAVLAQEDMRRRWVQGLFQCQEHRQVFWRVIASSWHFDAITDRAAARQVPNLAKKGEECCHGKPWHLCLNRFI